MNETIRYARGKGGFRWHALLNPGGAFCGYKPKNGWAHVTVSQMNFNCRKCLEQRMPSDWKDPSHAR